MKFEDVKVGMKLVDNRECVYEVVEKSNIFEFVMLRPLGGTLERTIGVFELEKQFKELKLADGSEKTNTVEEIKIIRNDKATIVILPNGEKGVAKCHPDDKHDPVIGLIIAYQKAKGLPINEYKANLDNFTSSELLEELTKRVTKSREN